MTANRYGVDTWNGSYIQTIEFFQGSSVHEVASHNPFQRLDWQRRMVEISLSGVSGGGRKRTKARTEALVKVEKRQQLLLPES